MHLPLPYRTPCGRPLDFDIHDAAAFSTSHPEVVMKDMLTGHANSPKSLDFLWWPVLKAGGGVLYALGGEGLGHSRQGRCFHTYPQS